MKEYLKCNKCNKKMIVTKEARSLLSSGYKYICICGGKYKQDF